MSDLQETEKYFEFFLNAGQHLAKFMHHIDNEVNHFARSF